MDLLDFLITSSIKKELLRLLWKNDLKASANQFSELCNAGYATVYDELETMVSKGLVLKEKVGRANLYKANSMFKEASMLKKLVGKTEKRTEIRQISEEELLAHLGQFGVPLGEFGKPRKSIPKEIMLVAAVMHAKQNATIARVLPVAISILTKELQFEKLRFYSQKENLTQEMGFFLELTALLKKSSRLKKESVLYKDKRLKNLRNFFVGKEKGKYAKLLEQQNSPRIAKKWHFTMNMGLDSFESLYNKSMGHGI